MNQPEASAQRKSFEPLFLLQWTDYQSFSHLVVAVVCFTNSKCRFYFICRPQASHRLCTWLDPARHNSIRHGSIHKQSECFAFAQTQVKVQRRAFVYVVYIRAQFLAYLLLLRMILFFRICLVFHMGVITFSMRIECFSFVKIPIQIK